MAWILNLYIIIISSAPGGIYSKVILLIVSLFFIIISEKALIILNTYANIELMPDKVIKGILTDRSVE